MKTGNTDRVTISSGIASAVLDFIKSKQNMERPFSEYESYYSRSSHSSHSQKLADIHLSLFIVNEETRKILSEVDKYYHVAYIYSSVYDQIHHLKDKEWMHEPWWGMTDTFDDLWREPNFVSAPLGQFLRHQEFVEDQLIIAIHDKWNEICNRGIKPSEISKESWEELLSVIKQSKDEIAKKLQECLS